MKFSINNKIVILFVLCILALSGNQTVFAHTPQSLYDQAWKLIDSKYVDKTTNGQDWSKWRHKYDDYLQTDEDAYIAINTMISSLDDQYTRFLPPDEFADEGNSIRGSLRGIGIQITEDNSKLLISALLDGTPAARAGLQSNDHIIQIDDKSTAGMSIDEAANSIQGKEGTFVKLTVNRAGEHKVYNVQREFIKVKSISTMPKSNIKLDNRIGYIRISTFMTKDASEEFVTALNQLSNKSAYIIDVRSNPGGLLFNALYMSNLFLNEKPMVKTVNRDGYQETIKATAKRYVGNKPIAILINNESASASEIFSSALKDNNKAILVGEKTYGKGLVQQISKMSGGCGMNITIQKYLTPNGSDINKKGITPDYTVKTTNQELLNGNDTQLLKAQDILLQNITTAVAYNK